MANGDAAELAGMDTVPGTMDLRLGYDEINKTRDYLANHQTGGTHPASAIASGILDAARIPDLAASKIISGTLDAARIPDLPGSKISSPVDSAVGAGGPTSTAYNRNSVGSGWFTVWMNSSLQFMRNTSSRRYKQNIRDWASRGAFGLRTVIFDRKGDDTPNDEVGFIAEEVLKVLPEAVVYFDGKIDGINDRVIIAALVDAVQELNARLAALEPATTAKERS